MICTESMFKDVNQVGSLDVRLKIRLFYHKYVERQINFNPIKNY